MILDSKTATLHSDYGSFNKPFGEIIIESDNTVVDGRRSEMAQSSDVYQRQPLLPGISSKNKDKWGALGSTSNYFNHDKIDELSHEGLNSGVPNISNSGIVKLDIPAPLREEPRFPKEKWKTFTGKLITAYSKRFNCGFFFFSFCLDGFFLNLLRK